MRAFAAVPELARAGVLAGATALHHEHLENRFGRFSFDVDLQNQREKLETVHRRLPSGRGTPLRLVSRLNEEMFQYAVRAGRRVLRVELARPYLRHRRPYQPSRHVAGLKVLSLADLVAAKVSAFSTRGFPRDLIDLLAVQAEKPVNWVRVLTEAANADDSDYNPAEFELRLMRHREQIASKDWRRELPVNHPPSTDQLNEFLDHLADANRIVARDFLV